MTVLLLLSTVQFSAILSNFVQGRLAVLVQSTELSFRSATALGLSLASVRNGPAILERARQTDPNISAIHVFDEEGRILQSTDAQPAPQIEAAGLAAHASSGGAVWRAETGDHLLSGKPILNALKTQPIGGVMVVYPKTGLQTSVRAIGASLALYAVGITAAVAALAIGVLRFGLRRLIAVFTGIEATFAAMEQREWRRAAGGTGSIPQPVFGFGIDTGALLNQFEIAERQYIGAGLELAALEAPCDIQPSGTAA